MPSIQSITIPGYRIGEVLASDQRFVLARALRERDGTRLLIKLPIDQPAPESARAALAREHEILSSLSIDAVARVTGRLDGAPSRAGPPLGLLFDDRGVKTLAALAANGRMQLGWVLDYAEQLVGALAELHRCGIVHRGLRPQAVWVEGPASRVRLADFTEAARDAAEAASALAPQLYASRLAYAAPEHTGRIGRGCDYRSDFYSLGVLLYELMVGRVPFNAVEPLELIHAHLAKLPQPPAEAAPGLPVPVSQIVLKLLAKSPDERYQSALALQRDLQRCRREWSQRGRVSLFTIAERDVPERFAVPQRLYGRANELAALKSAYDAASTGAARMVLVGGYAGVGKTSLIGALQETLVRSGGRFVSGKFDQLSLDAPYRALAHALRQLVRLLLSEPPARLDAQREQLMHALGSGAAVIAEIVPELQFLLGEQTPPQRLPAAEAQNRFTLAFQNLIAALATPQQPLLIFLDDLQWADSATLQLLAQLLSGSEVRHLLLVGAYRDHEIDADHPLLSMCAALERDAVRLERIMLRPLDLSALSQLAADALNVDTAEAMPLAKVLLAKTDGNPFFVTQFLLALHKEGLIAFDAAQSRWNARLEAIADAAITDNVIDLMSRKIAQLAPATQHVLSLAACIGNRFDLDTLCAISQQAPQAVHSDLADAALEGLIVPQAEHEFAFLHDRVQQAAYARLAHRERPEAHLRIGRVLHGRWQRERADELLFDLASHLNLGADLIEGGTERIDVARINLAAGCRAKLSAAHAAALGFFQAGVALLGPAHWRSHAELAFDLHLEVAQCLYLCGRFEAAEAACVALLPHAASALARARVIRLRLTQFENRGLYADALDSARACLAPLGVDLPQRDADKFDALQREIAAIEARLGERPIASLVELDTMSDPAMRMAMSILTDIWSDAYIIGDAVLARLISATLVRLSLEHGNSEDSAYGYVTHAITVGPVRGDYQAAYAYGTLALKVNERFDDRRLRAKVYQQFHAHVNLWCRPMHTCIDYAREACRSGLESGDFLYAAYGASTQSWPAIVSCQDLQACVADLTPNLALVTRLRNVPFADSLRLVMSWAQALRGQTQSPLSLTHAGIDGEAAFDEQAYAQAYRGNPFFTMFHAIAKLQLAYLHGHVEQAYAAARSVRATANTLVGMVWSVLFELWNGLTLAARLHLAADAQQRAAWLAEIEAAQRTFAALARSCAANFACHALLLDAELQAARERPLEALERFEAALAAAEASGCVQQLALAHELYGKHWLRRGNRKVAALYLRHALGHYTRWGAQAKVRSLQEAHGALLDETLAPVTAVAPRAAAPETAHLDLAATVKAAHAIAEPLEVDALVERLLRIALEHAGARRGALIEDLDGELQVSAIGRIDGGTVGLRQTLAPGVEAHCSRAVVRYVQRTRVDLVIGDATRDERFANDEWVLAQQPLSILCLPIAYQGRLTAILYLEHDLVRDAFSPQRVEVLQLLLAQAAISLHIARLALRMREAVSERERAEDTLRAIEAGTSAMTGEDFFRALVRNLARSLHVRYAFVAECFDAPGAVPSARIRALWAGDDFGSSLQEYALAGTPCEAVAAGRSCHHPSDLQALFPADLALQRWGARSYLGMPLLASSGQVIGHMVLLDDRPFPDAAVATLVMRLSVGRAGAELERLQATESLQRALTEVQRLTDRLQQENVYLRRELIANVSHDLRSPLASLRGYLETLLLKEHTLTPDERHSYLSIAARQAQHLQTLIAELFELARLDFDGYRINAEPVQLVELAQDVVQKFRLAADAKGIGLRADACVDLPFVCADIALLERTLSNLIDNALTHTPAGGSVELRLVSDDPRRVTVSVRDSGRGIAPADLPRVFERFYRADKARNRDAGGSGLGLAIVKRIVELHGGEVQVESEEGVGTTFWFSLAARAATTAAPTEAAATQGRSTSFIS